MADLTQLVSEGVGSPILCKASDTAGSTLELPCPVKMDEFYEKVYKSDLRYFNKNLASDSKSIKGFRWNCNLTWNGLTADQIRNLQTLLNAREKLRLYHHEDYKTVYHDVYLNSSYKPEWWGDTYIVDLLNVTLKFTALSLDSTIPYHTTTAADSDTPVLGTDPTPIGMSVDLDAMFQSSAASTTTWTFEATTDEEFEPVYKINEDLSGNLYVKHLGWRYKANVKMQDITVSEYVNIVAMYNQKKDLLFTPRKRDWSTGHYTGRLAREMKIPRKDVWVGYTGSIPFEGRDLLADIDFYPNQMTSLIELYVDNSASPLQWKDYSQQIDYTKIYLSGTHTITGDSHGSNNADKAPNRSGQKAIYIPSANISAMDTLAADQSFSFMIKFKPPNNGDKFYVRHSASNKGWILLNEVGGNIDFYLYLDGNLKVCRPAIGPLLNAWQFIYCSYDGGNDKMYCNLYDVNGSSQATKTTNVSGTYQVPTATWQIETYSADQIFSHFIYWNETASAVSISAVISWCNTYQ